MTEQEALYKYCLRLGDDALIQSYRLSQWCSNAPILEEDLALTNFALDMTGRARSLFTYAAGIEGLGKTEDDLAYRRAERNYYNHLLMEMPNGDFAQTMARLLYSSTWEYYYYSELQHGADTTLAAIAAKTVKEIKYHMTHAADWVIRLGDGTEESHRRIQKGIDDLWAYTGELFETDDVEQLLLNKHISVDPQLIRPKWEQRIAQVLTEATLVFPGGMFMQTGGRNGLHTEHMGYILTEMQYLQRTYPEAIW
jgi:ring-1,2-phenylacetyl-CoA epoxidase subunit PaaC